MKPFFLCRNTATTTTNKAFRHKKKQLPSNKRDFFNCEIYYVNRFFHPLFFILFTLKHPVNRPSKLSIHHRMNKKPLFFIIIIIRFFSSLLLILSCARALITIEMKMQNKNDFSEKGERNSNAFSRIPYLFVVCHYRFTPFKKVTKSIDLSSKILKIIDGYISPIQSKFIYRLKNS